MANQRLQERIEQNQKELLEKLNASNFPKEINNPERKNWFWYQPNESGTYNRLLNDPLVKYITDWNSSNKERIFKATSEEKLNKEINKLENKIASSPRYDIKYAGLLEGPFAAKPRISGAVEWSFKFLTVIAIAAIVFTSSAGLGFAPILISSLVAPACYAAMRGTRSFMFRTQQNDLLETSQLELDLEAFQAKIKALGEQQEFFRNDKKGKEYVKNLTKTLNSDLVQTYSKIPTNNTNNIDNSIKDKLLKYDGTNSQITLNQLKANLTTLIDTNKFVEFNKDNQTLEKNINLDFDKNERVIKAVQALVDSKLAENAQNVIDLSDATFLTPKGSDNTYIISKEKVYLFNGSEVTDTGLDGKGNNIATGIAVYDKSTGKDLENADYLKELKKISGLEPNNDVANNVKNLIENIGTSKSFENYKQANVYNLMKIDNKQYGILKNITNASKDLETSQTQAFSDTITNIISDIYNNKDISNEKLEQQISNLNWKPSNNEKAATEAEAAAAEKTLLEKAKNVLLEKVKEGEGEGGVEEVNKQNAFLENFLDSPKIDVSVIQSEDTSLADRVRSMLNLLTTEQIIEAAEAAVNAQTTSLEDAAAADATREGGVEEQAAAKEFREAKEEFTIKQEAAKEAAEAAAEAEKKPAEEIKELLQALKAKVNEDKGSGLTNEQGEIQTILKNLKDNGGIPDSENISNLFRKILDSAKGIQEPLIGEMRNLGISLKPGNNIELPSTMSHIMGKQDKGR